MLDQSPVYFVLQPAVPPHLLKRSLGIRVVVALAFIPRKQLSMTAIDKAPTNVLSFAVAGLGSTFT